MGFELAGAANAVEVTAARDAGRAAAAAKSYATQTGDASARRQRGSTPSE